MVKSQTLLILPEAFAKVTFCRLTSLSSVWNVLHRLLKKLSPKNCGFPFTYLINFLFHIFFYADVVFLIGKATNTNLHSILRIMEMFGALSGLKLNDSKSYIIFP